LNLSKFILNASGFPMVKAERELSAIQSLSVDAFAEWQERKRWEIARFHFDNNEYYRTKVGKYFPSNWQDLPVITKQDLQQPVQKLLTRGLRLDKCYTAFTSGSSGVPMYFAKDTFAHAMTWALIANRYSWHGLKLGDKQARFTVMPNNEKRRRKEVLKDKLMNRVRCNVFDLSEAALTKYLHLFQVNKFRYVYGYTSALVAFARFLESQNIVLKEVCPTLSLCISTSELVTPRQAQLLEQWMGIKHVREYGASETCITGFDDKDGDFILTAETLYNEIEEGDNSGTILTTSLYNKAFPMVKYQLGDDVTLGERRKGIYQIIAQMNGRSNDMIHLPEGKTTSPMMIDYVIAGLVAKTNVLKEYVARQTAIDTFVFEMVTERPLNDDEVRLLIEQAESYLAKGICVEIKYTDKIVRPASGKQRFFYSEL